MRYLSIYQAHRLEKKDQGQVASSNHQVPLLLEELLYILGSSNDFNEIDHKFKNDFLIANLNKSRRYGREQSAQHQSSD